ncbi:MAG: enterotoxin [Verrucomicrobiae bacterium]|nr:enterotoxin [Verrucomicrobiae bacterium]NNJ43401.1 enterotoxin [Akkermansiaceae bacterium]
MKIDRLIVYALLNVVFLLPASGLDYPGRAPGKASRSVTSKHSILENAVLRCAWKIDSDQSKSLTLRNKEAGQTVSIGDGHLPRVVLSGGRVIDLGSIRASKPWRLENHSIVAVFEDVASGLSIRWTATLDDHSNAIIQALCLTASNDTKVDEVVFIDARVDDVHRVGQVDGSVVVCGDVFMAVEHPLAKNEVVGSEGVRCALPRGNVLKAGQSWTHTSVLGVVPSGQLRRGFLYYIERRRAHPYRPFLHYNNWYDVILARKTERATEAECLETIAHYGRELLHQREVKMDAFVWDDGWDDFNSLWGFHKGFPDGFKNLNKAASKYGVAQGVWMSPWGGYASAKLQRLAFGQAQGYETNSSGFSMAGVKYQKEFRNVCLSMMRDHGVTFFKFDGMGGGHEAVGTKAELADDIDAVLDVSRALHRENPEVFISATIGTWASPFWTLYADSIWRQGNDNGLFGKGDTRQQWISYRDKLCYDNVVQLGPLYPLNSLMLGGVIIGDRRSPALLVRHEKSIADEVWSFFGSGTCLQELYVNPKLPTERTWDVLAKAAKWSRANRDVLVDTHWVGGNPGKAEVYGWASWRPGKGILVLRNPSDQPQAFKFTPKEAFELPVGVKNTMGVEVLYPQDRKLAVETWTMEQPVNVTLQAFEVLVMELQDAR